MKILYLIIAIVLITTNIHSQTPNWIWAKQATGAGSQEGLGIATDHSGNIIATGSFQPPTITFGSTTLTSVGLDDAILVKYNSAGNIIWATSAGGTKKDLGVSVTTDASDNIYLVGQFYSPSITFGSYTLLNADASGSTYDIFIVKYSPTGTVLWAKRVGGANSDFGNSITIDTFGNVYITGTFYSSTITFGTTTLTSAGSGDMFLAKYNSAGNVAWAHRAGSTGSEDGNGVATDNTGNIFVVGRFSTTLLVGTTTLTSAGSDDIYLIKYDSLANVLWAKSAGGIGFDKGSAVTTDATGNAYITGDFDTTSATFGTYNIISAGSTDAFIVKYNPSGIVQWAKSISGTNYEYGYSIASTSTSIYVSGSSTSPSIIIDTATYTFPPSATDPLFIAQYDFNGNIICSSWLPSGGDDNNAVATDNTGNAYISGDFALTPFIVGADTLTLSSLENFFITKYNCFTSHEGISEQNNNQNISIYPNPFTTSVNIDFEQQQNNSTIKITDVLGQEIKSINFTGKQFSLNKEELQNGIYFIQITDQNKNTINKKIIIQ